MRTSSGGQLQGQAAPAETVRDIETITEEILGLKQTAGNAILEIGQRLIEAKHMLSEGEWLPWLEEQVEFSPRTAQRFMKLSREWTDATALSYRPSPRRKKKPAPSGRRK